MCISKNVSQSVSAVYRWQQRLYLSSLIRGVHALLSAVHRVRETERRPPVRVIPSGATVAELPSHVYMVVALQIADD